MSNLLLYSHGPRGCFCSYFLCRKNTCISLFRGWEEGVCRWRDTRTRRYRQCLEEIESIQAKLSAFVWSNYWPTLSSPGTDVICLYSQDTKPFYRTQTQPVLSSFLLSVPIPDKIGIKYLIERFHSRDQKTIIVNWNKRRCSMSIPEGLVTGIGKPIWLS